MSDEPKQKQEPVVDNREAAPVASQSSLDELAARVSRLEDAVRRAGFKV